MDHDLATPKGTVSFFSIDFLYIFGFICTEVLMEEAGDAIEFLLFGFRIQYYGPQHPIFMVIELVCCIF
jgi:hypothetical protein